MNAPIRAQLSFGCALMAVAAGVPFLFLWIQEVAGDMRGGSGINAGAIALYLLIKLLFAFLTGLLTTWLFAVPGIVLAATGLRTNSPGKRMFGIALALNLLVPVFVFAGYVLVQIAD